MQEKYLERHPLACSIIYILPHVTLSINCPVMVALIHYVLICLPEDVQVTCLLWCKCSEMTHIAS